GGRLLRRGGAVCAASRVRIAARARGPRRRIRGLLLTPGAHEAEQQEEAGADQQDLEEADAAAEPAAEQHAAEQSAEREAGETAHESPHPAARRLRRRG